MGKYLLKKKPHEEMFTVDNGSLHYLEWEDKGHDTHFLHANGMCAGAYTPFLNRLADDSHIFAYDVRGHGDSSQPGENPVRNWEMFTSDLVEFIIGKMNPPVIGIGHSLGAVVTYMAAAEFPELFSSIILIDPVMLSLRIRTAGSILQKLGLIKLIGIVRGARRRRRTFKSIDEVLERFSSGRGMFGTWDKDFIQSYLGCALRVDSEGNAALKCDPELEAQIYEKFPARVFRYAEKIKCPVLAVRGEFSDTFPVESIEKLKKLVNDCRTITIKGAGHFVPMEKPEECSNVILEFINSL